MRARERRWQVRANVRWIIVLRRGHPGMTTSVAAGASLRRGCRRSQRTSDRADAPPNLVAVSNLVVTVRPATSGAATSSAQLRRSRHRLPAVLARGEVAAGHERDPRAARARRHVDRPPVRVRGARRHRGFRPRAGVPEHACIKTLIMEDDAKRPMIVLMHGDREVSTKNLARAIGVKSVQPCAPQSPTGTRATRSAARARSARAARCPSTCSGRSPSCPICTSTAAAAATSSA